MHPDLPSPGGPGPDPVEQLLRALPVASLPDDWRSEILAAAALPHVPPFFSKTLTSFLASAWGLIAVLHLATPLPLPAEAHPLPPSPYPREIPADGGFAEPWLAQLQQPSPSFDP